MAANSTKEMILQTASNLFYDKGYNLIGINEIIDQAGIAKATLYNHFKSKEDILLAYLDKKDEQLYVSLKEYISKKKSGNPKLIGVLQFLLVFYQQENFNGCWCIRSLAEIPQYNIKVKRKIKENKSSFLKLLNHIVVENKPELKPKQQQSLAAHLYLLYESAVTESHLHRDKWPIEESIKLLKIRLNHQ